ncbi:UDP-glycosyltransferase 71E1-like [Neltuma alba]|uniref:UDP-glycosyltransferase 71E1-like n=1 Tax=Neltuma alba TaxID=207710 RepID=UPI0010A2FE0E|nr:UDP-glycosyltransferase 71E1-like [Prosopis alba]XP_028791160.1 UDP-glycosyltransferase 71E1-like [Prosopis alba]
MKKSQLVFVPIPGTSHLVPTVEFAKRLVNRHENLSITLLIIKAPNDPTGDTYTLHLTSSLSFPKRLRFILLPPLHDPNTDHHLINPASFIDSLVENQKPNVTQAVSALISGTDSPRLARFVVDMYCSTMIDVANEFGVPTVGFFTASAAFLGYMLHTHTLRERDGVDTTAFNFKDSGAEFAIPSLKTEILNRHAVQSLSNSDLPKVYPVGPILSVGEAKDTKMVQRRIRRDGALYFSTTSLIRCCLLYSARLLTIFTRVKQIVSLFTCTCAPRP